MKSYLLHLIYPLLIFLSLTACDKTDDQPDPLPPIETAADLSQALQDIYDEHDAPGFALAIVKNDDILYQEGFGYADITSGRAYTPQTTQAIGSISKTFVAAAVVKAIEQGHFTLETDINELLPFSIQNPKQPNDVIRVKHLVTHTSGLIDREEAYWEAYYILPGENTATTGAQLLLDVGAGQREGRALGDFLEDYYLPGGDSYSTDNFAATEPGAVWQYSNIASSLMAYIVEEAAGMPFRDYVKTHIFDVLGMNNSSFAPVGLDAATAATFYFDPQTPLPAYALDSYPDGSVVTSSEDLNRYLQDMMRGARGTGGQLFSAEGYAMLFAAALPAGTVPAFAGDNQGIFWFLDGNTIQHDGSDPGITTNLMFDVSSNTGFLLLTNMDASTDENEVAYFKLAGAIGGAIEAFVEAN